MVLLKDVGSIFQATFPKIKMSTICSMVVRCLLFICDIVTLPIYLILQRPWTQWAKISKIRAAANGQLHVEENHHKYNVKVWTKLWPEEKVSKYGHCKTIAEMMSSAVADYSDRNLFGIRKVVKENESMSADGKKVVKKVLDNKYTWFKYSDIDNRINNVVNGLMSTGIKRQDKVVIMLETRMEWMLVAQSIFRMGSVLCTLYDTLGIAGIIAAINELESSHVVCNGTMARTLEGIKDKIPKVKCLIIVGGIGKRSELNKIAQVQANEKKIPRSNHLDIVSLDELEKLPAKADVSKMMPPSPTDLALIMYTSGTTGTPKGAMFNQSQFVKVYHIWNNLYENMNTGERTNESQQFKTKLKDLEKIGGRISNPEIKIKRRNKESADVKDIAVDAIAETSNGPMFLAYLPLAHIFEFMMQTICMMRGIPIGFSSPSTIFDHSPGLEPGAKGDVTILKPTIIIAVPLILERLRTQIKSLNNNSNRIYSDIIFPAMVDHTSFWRKLGMDSPIIGSVIGDQAKKILGGRVRTILTGSAPVSQDLINFIQSTIGADVIVSYGATESFGIGCSMDRFGSSSFNSSTGAPMAGGKISLIDWKEGHYSPLDIPNPRGELLIGAECVSLGYFKKPAESAEAIFVDGNGGRWLRTGDIAEIDNKYGVITIIDRKKDLVKLSNGQFISLTKIEVCLKRNRFVDNLCIAVDPKCNYVVAIIVPNRENFMNLVHNSVINDDDDGLTNCYHNQSTLIGDEVSKANAPTLIKFDQNICNDPIIKQLILESMTETGRDGGLSRIEIPLDCYVTAEEWTPSNGLVTASLKLRRKQVTDHYKSIIAKMYHDKIWTRNGK